MSSTVTPNCSIVVNNVNNEYGSPNNYWAFIIVLALTGAITWLIQFYCDSFNEMEKQTGDINLLWQGAEGNAVGFLAMCGLRFVLISQLFHRCPLSISACFLKLLTVVIWRNLSFCTSLLAPLLKVSVIPQRPQGVSFIGMCVSVSTFCCQASLWREIGGWPLLIWPGSREMG